jgi:hypothetical protein
MGKRFIMSMCIACMVASGGCGPDAVKSWHGTWVTVEGRRGATIELKQENGMYLMSIGGAEPGVFTYDSEPENFYTTIDNEKYTVTFRDSDNLRFASPRSYIDFRRK